MVWLRWFYSIFVYILAAKRTVTGLRFSVSEYGGIVVTKKGSISRSSHQKLGDPEVRSALSLSIAFRKRNVGQIHEVPVCNGMAIADVVILDSIAHCIEIKSDLDKMNRALKQALYFDKAFKRVSLATTEAQLEKARGLLPSHWGIIIISNKGESLSVSVVRNPKNSPSFSLQESLEILWKSELLSIAATVGVASVRAYFSKTKIIDELMQSTSSSRLLRALSDELKSRDRNRLAYK